MFDGQPTLACLCGLALACVHVAHVNKFELSSEHSIVQTSVLQGNKQGMMSACVRSSTRLEPRHLKPFWKS